MDYRLYSFAQLDTRTLYDILAHRFEVFVLGQRCIYHDFDGLDQTALHLVARDGDGRVQGYVRLLPAVPGQDGRAEHSFGRLSVKEGARGRGVGGELVRRACAYLTGLEGQRPVRIAAMAYLEHFYEGLGFVRRSDVFDKEGVPHVTMQYAAR